MQRERKRINFGRRGSTCGYKDLMFSPNKNTDLIAYNFPGILKLNEPDHGVVRVCLFYMGSGEPCEIHDFVSSLGGIRSRIN